MKQKKGRGLIIVGFVLVMLLIAGCSGGGSSDSSGSGQVSEDSLNSIDFSGVWQGTVFIDEVRNSEEYKDLEDAEFFCEMVLDLDADGNGFADIYLDGDLAGSSLTVKVVQDRPNIKGELFESPFEFYGTFSEDSGDWKLVGGGEVEDGDAVFSMVFRLAAASVAQAPADPETPAVDEPEAPAADSLDEFLVGSWMRDELFGEYKVKTFNRDGTAVFSMDKPGSGDDINTWPGGNWTIVQSATGEWAVVGDLLVADVTPEHLSLETEVKIIDNNTIEIVELLTKTLYYRVP